MKTNNLTLCALFSAIICVFSVLSIPTGSVPITLGLFAVILCGSLLPARLSVISAGIYILIGISGLPVFQAFVAEYTFSPVRQADISYHILPSHLFADYFSAPHNQKNKLFKSFVYLFGTVSILILCYTIAVIHFTVVMNCSIKQSIAECVLPFIIFDIIKIEAAFCTAESIYKKIKIKG